MIIGSFADTICMGNEKLLRGILIIVIIFSLIISAFPAENKLETDIRNMDVKLVPAEPRMPVSSEKPNISENVKKYYRIYVKAFSEETDAFLLVKELRKLNLNPKYELTDDKIFVVLSMIDEVEKPKILQSLKEKGFENLTVKLERKKL